MNLQQQQKHITTHTCVYVCTSWGIIFSNYTPSKHKRRSRHILRTTKIFQSTKKVDPISLKIIRGRRERERASLTTLSCSKCQIMLSNVIFGKDGKNSQTASASHRPRRERERSHIGEGNPYK